MPSKHTERIIELIKNVPKDGGSRTDLDEKFYLECHKNFDGFSDVYGRMSWEKPAPTITAGFFAPSKGRFLHPDEHRAITPREAAILQGFPRDYFFSTKKGKTGCASMIGNALPPGFVKRHAKQIVKQLKIEKVAHG
jgi:DNA (cytosine-5)-methyltransferase 1